jgi:hypothetical protein
MHRIIGLSVIIFGTAGILLMAVDWLLQQRRPYPRDARRKKGYKALQNEAADGRLTYEGKEEAHPAGETGLSEETAQVAAASREDETEKAASRPAGGQKARQVPGDTISNRWYTGAFPARALIEELSLLPKLREILHSAEEIPVAIRTVEPGFDGESRIAGFIYENNLQHFEIVSRGRNTTVYIREGQQCSAGNDRCIFYKGYLWLNPELVDYDLSSRKR